MGVKIQLRLTLGQGLFMIMAMGITFRKALEQSLTEVGFEQGKIKELCDSFFKRINESLLQKVVAALAPVEKKELEDKLAKVDKDDYVTAGQVLTQVISNSGNKIDMEVLKQNVAASGIDTAWRNLRAALDQDQADKFITKFDLLKSDIMDE